MRRALFLILVVVAASVVATVPARAERVTLSGEVTYRERAALPPGARLRVRLVDLARPEVATVQAEAALASPGRVPLTFTLDFEERVIVPDRRYGLVAEIFTDADVWFRNDPPYPVEPLQPAGPVTLIVSLAGHAPESPVVAAEPPAPLLDITWFAEEVRGERVAAGATLSISSDMRAGGRGGCNAYFAQAVLDGQRLQFSEVAATRMSCPAADDEEAAFFAALGAARFWRMRDDRLVLLDATNRDLVQFARRER